MPEYTVKQLAALAKVSVRTLHYYDEIGLLKPAYIRDNGYRCYGKSELLRLQQVLLYRELDMPLGDIAAILDRGETYAVSALEAHKDRLVDKITQYNQLVHVIETTLLHIKGHKDMKDETLYNWTSDAKQAEYEAWLIEHYGEEMQGWIDISKARIGQLTEAERVEAMAAMEKIGGDLCQAFQNGIAPGSMALEPVLARHNEWVSYMWGRPCSPEAYAGLAELYETNPEFVARFEGQAQGFTTFLASAMKTWAARSSNIQH